MAKQPRCVKLGEVPSGIQSGQHRCADPPALARGRLWFPAFAGMTATRIAAPIFVLEAI
jgi:hypothetical protein